MLDQIRDAGYRTARDLTKTWHPGSDLAAITTMNQLPLPKPPDPATVTIHEMMAYEQAVRASNPKDTT